MKQVYKCDFCDQVFTHSVEAKMHEEICGYNPKNKINDKLLFRLSMIYDSLDNIIACAMHEVAKDHLDFLYTETDRASSTNCVYTIYQHKRRMLNALRDAEIVDKKHKGRNSSTYKDVIRENPELFNAIVSTLKRKAWNE